MDNLKEFINYINSNLNGDLKNDFEVFFKNVITNDRQLTIDEAIEVLIKCPKLNNIVGELRKQKVTISNSALYSAYKALHDKPLSKDTKIDINVEDKPYDDEDEIYNEDEDEYENEFDKSSAFGNQKDIDILKLYLAEIARYPLLSREEINDIYKKIETSDSETKEKLLEKVVKHNLRLVVSIAKRYQGCGVPLLDLIQEGNEGLMKAAKKYNYKLGYNFSTYAFWWIRQGSARCVDDTSLNIKIPVHAHEIINRMRSYINASIITKGEKPSDEQLKTIFKLNDKSLDLYKNIYNRNYIVSLNSPVKTLDGADSTLEDFIADDVDAIEEKTQNIAYADLKDDLEYSYNLTPRESKVIKLRYGLEGGKRHTLEEIGKMMGVTRERVRQIEVKAFKKLRHNINFKAKYANDYKYNPLVLSQKKK